MCGGHDGNSIVKFWRHLKGLKEYQHHQPLQNFTDAELSKTIPCALHADGAEFHRDTEYFVTSWTSAFQCGSAGNCLASRYPISLVCETQMSDETDFRPWFSIILLGHHWIIFTPMEAIITKYMLSFHACSSEWWLVSRNCQPDRLINVGIITAYHGCLPRALSGTARCEPNPRGSGGVEPPLQWFGCVSWTRLLWWRLWKGNLQGWPGWETDRQRLQVPWFKRISQLNEWAPCYELSFEKIGSWSPVTKSIKHPHHARVYDYQWFPLATSSQVDLHDFQSRPEGPNAAPPPGELLPL